MDALRIQSLVKIEARRMPMYEINHITAGDFWMCKGFSLIHPRPARLVDKI
jgi:hypothetical protein